jgi:hypothetical protein
MFASLSRRVEEFSNYPSRVMDRFHPYHRNTRFVPQINRPVSAIAVHLDSADMIWNMVSCSTDLIIALMKSYLGEAFPLFVSQFWVCIIYYLTLQPSPKRKKTTSHTSKPR